MKPFFLVWRENGAPPTHRHESHDSAAKEAERLARSMPGTRFYVLEATAAVQRNEVHWDVTDRGDDHFTEIPF